MPFWPQTRMDIALVDMNLLAKQMTGRDFIGLAWLGLAWQKGGRNLRHVKGQVEVF